MDTTDTNDDAEAAALLQAGEAADASGDDTSSANHEPAQRAAGDDAIDADPAAPAPKVEDGKPSDTPEKKPAEQQQKQEPPKEPSKFEKAKQREADAWKKINEEKAQIQRDREELARLRQTPPAEPKPTPKAEPAKDDRGFTAQDYEDAAKGFDDDGDTDLAKAARAKAQELRQKDAAQVPATPQGQPAQSEQFDRDWQADMDKTLKANPDFLKQDSEEAKALVSLLRDEPIFGMVPGGFTKALAVVQLQQQAGQVPGLKEENSKLKAEVDRLNKLTGVNGGSPTAPTRQKSFDELSEPEMEAQLTRAAAQADGFV